LELIRSGPEEPREHAELVEAFLERPRVAVVGGIISAESGTELGRAVEEPLAAVVAALPGGGVVGLAARDVGRDGAREN